MKLNARIWRQLNVHRRAFSTTHRRLDSYGFIGLGQMGFQMALNLKAKLAPSDTMRVYDIQKDATAKLVNVMKSQKLGGASVEVASSAAEASRDSDTVITCLPEPKNVKSTFQAILKDLPHRSTPRLFIDTSTIDPSSSREVAATVAKALPGAQGQFVDAPMSGGVVGAKAGTLTFMLGAPDELVDRIEPVLLRMGKRVLHCGPQGAGLSAKLANNYLLAINNIATAEAMNLGVRWGLDPKVLAGVINASTGRCWPSEVNNPVPGVLEAAPSSHSYVGGFGIDLMLKDLRLAMVAAEEADARLPLAEKARELYEEASKSKVCKGKDFSVVYRLIDAKQ